jgi:hypothetical protein
MEPTLPKFVRDFLLNIAWVAGALKEIEWKSRG